MSKRVQDEYKYWNEIGKGKNYEIHICDKDISAQECLDIIIPEVGNAKNILEIGCGVGRLTIPMAIAMQDSQVDGIDISEEMILHAIDNLKLANDAYVDPIKGVLRVIDNISFTQNDGRNISAKSDTYDACYSMITFQHIDRDGVIHYVKEIGRVLKSGGVFRFQFVEGRENSRFSQQFSYLEVQKWLTNSGFIVKKVDKDLIYKSWIWITAVKQ